MMAITARALTAIVIVIVVACHEPAVEVSLVASQDPSVFVAAPVTRADANLWRHSPNEKRGVRVTIGIPTGMDSVVIEPAEGDAGPDKDSVEFIEVNSVRVLAPSKLRRILVRSGDGDGMNVELMVKLGHCTRLDLVAVRYWDGGPAVGSVEELPQKHKLPDCCVPSSATEAVDAADSLGRQADDARPTREPREPRPGGIPVREVGKDAALRNAPNPATRRSGARRSHRTTTNQT